MSHLICTLSLTQRFYLSPVSCTYTTDDLSNGNFTAICCMYSITNENALKRAIFVRGSEGGQLVKICTQTFHRKCAWPQSGHLLKHFIWNSPGHCHCEPWCLQPCQGLFLHSPGQKRLQLTFCSWLSLLKELHAMFKGLHREIEIDLASFEISRYLIGLASFEINRYLIGLASFEISI